MRKIIQMMKIVLPVLFVCVCLGVPAFAKELPEAEENCSIMISLQGEQPAEMKLTGYMVAKAVMTGSAYEYVLTDSFADSGVDLSNVENVEKLAETLSAYAAASRISGITKAADEDGIARFEELAPGFYLIVPEAVKPGEAAVSPFLITVPEQDKNGNWVYHVEASPKIAIFEEIDIKVKKIWNDGGSESLRPHSVTISLLHDSQKIASATLDEANGWSHTFRNLPKKDGYSVVEESLSGYVATYRRSEDGATYTITNTPKLAQTGQLNWPVPLLAAGGMVLFATGWYMVFLKGREDV